MKIEMNDDPGFETPGSDPLDINRHLFKKGRLEFMGGAVYYEQGQNVTSGASLFSEGKKLMNNERNCNYAYPMGAKTDPMAHDLQVDITEQ